MQSVVRMIDKALEVCPSKSAIARALDTDPQTLWQYSAGRKHMPAAKVMRLATLANLNATLELGRYEAEYITKKADGAPAGIVAAVCLVGALSADLGDAKAASSQYPSLRDSFCTLCAMAVAWLLQKMTSPRPLVGPKQAF